MFALSSARSARSSSLLPSGAFLAAGVFFVRMFLLSGAAASCSGLVWARASRVSFLSVASLASALASPSRSSFVSAVAAASLASARARGSSVASWTLSITARAGGVPDRPFLVLDELGGPARNRREAGGDVSVLGRRRCLQVPRAAVLPSVVRNL